jgi:hypothetical protein
MLNKKVVYIAGAITGVERYWERFEAAEEALIARGYIPLSPATHPKGLEPSQYMRMCFAQIDCADMVLFLPNWKESSGARLERMYCQYIGKPCFDDICSIKPFTTREEAELWPS